MEADREHFGGHATLLEAGSEASSHGDEIVMERVGLAGIDRALSWSDGYLMFDETPLPRVVAEFNRYRVQKIEIDDDRINSIRIGGRFRSSDADAFLTLLQRGFPVVVSHDRDRVRLHGR
jgi:transmembrane sensor